MSLVLLWKKNWCGQYSMVITQLLLSEILKQAAVDSKISRARTWNQNICNILPVLDYCTFLVIMSYCGRHQPAPKPCVRCLKVFSPEATPLPPTPKLMESQLSLHEEMEALGSNIHNVPLISVGATEGGFLSLLAGFSLPGNPLA